MEHTANVLSGKPFRGFESLPLRKDLSEANALRRGEARQCVLREGFERRSDVSRARETASRGREISERRRGNICDRITRIEPKNMDKSRLEKMIDDAVLTQTREIQSIVEKQSEVAEKLIDRENQFSPLRTDLLLRHLDILLETAKNFLLIFSTIFVTALALDTGSVTNIDADLIRSISAGVIAISVLAIICILWSRNTATKAVLEYLRLLQEKYGEIVNVKFDGIALAFPAKRSELTEALKTELRKNPYIKEAAPDL